MSDKTAPENPMAFPFSAAYGHPAACGGMTLRDYIATAALTGMLSGRSATALDGTPHEYALDAYHYADAMLAARQGPTS